MLLCASGDARDRRRFDGLTFCCEGRVVAEAAVDVSGIILLESAKGDGRYTGGL